MGRNTVENRWKIPSPIRNHLTGWIQRGWRFCEPSNRPSALWKFIRCKHILHISKNAQWGKGISRLSFKHPQQKRKWNKKYSCGWNIRNKKCKNREKTYDQYSWWRIPEFEWKWKKIIWICCFWNWWQQSQEMPWTSTPWSPQNHLQWHKLNSQSAWNLSSSWSLHHLVQRNFKTIWNLC